MRHLAYIFFLALLCTSCQDGDLVSYHINKAEFYFKTNPSLSNQILDSISEPDELDNKKFAHWCLMKAKLSDSLHLQLPSSSQLKRVFEYYSGKKKISEQALLGLYLGRSYIEERNYSEAIQSLLKALSLAIEAGDPNTSGYISSYIADLHEYNKDMRNARKNYQIAADYFKKAKNEKNYILALKDISRELAFQDSCVQALSYLQKADSLAVKFKNKKVQSAVYNGIGNVYRIMGNYSEADKFLLLSISIDSTVNTAPGLLALSNLHLEAGNYTKSIQYLNKVDTTNINFAEAIVYNKYRLAKKQEKYFEALMFLEDFQEKFEANMISKEKANIFELDKKYNQIKVKKENQELKIHIQFYIILFSITLCILLSISLLHQLFKKRVVRKINNQQQEIYNFNIKVRVLTTELENKRVEFESVLREKKQDSKLQRDIDSLVFELRRIKRNQLLNSAIGKKLNSLSQTHIPQNKKSLITESMFEKMEKEVKLIYPNFKSQILELNSDISESEWYYCCLILFGFDIKSVSVLLCISPGSVRTRRLRIRQKLGIELKESTLFEYFTNTLT